MSSYHPFRKCRELSPKESWKEDVLRSLWGVKDTVVSLSLVNMCICIFTHCNLKVWQWHWFWPMLSQWLSCHLRRNCHEQTLGYFCTCHCDLPHMPCSKERMNFSANVTWIVSFFLSVGFLAFARKWGCRWHECTLSLLYTCSSSTALPDPQYAHNTWTTNMLEMWLCKDKDPTALGPHLFLGLLPLSWEGLNNMTSYRNALVSSSKSFWLTSVLPFRSWTDLAVVEQLLSLASGAVAVQYCSVFTISIQFQNTSLIKSSVFVNKDR